MAVYTAISTDSVSSVVHYRQRYAFVLDVLGSGVLRSCDAYDSAYLYLVYSDRSGKSPRHEIGFQEVLRMFTVVAAVGVKSSAPDSYDDNITHMPFAA